MPSLASPPDVTRRLYRDRVARALKCGRARSARGGRRDETNAAAHLPWPRGAIVGRLDGAQRLENLRSHGSPSARLLAHVERHELIGGGEIAVLRVKHLVEVVEALGVVLEEEGGEAPDRLRAPRGGRSRGLRGRRW